MGDWTNLPSDVLLVIATYFNIHSDYLRFRAVCASWRSSLPKWPKHLHDNIPWLMLPKDDDDNENDQKLLGLYNPLNVHHVYYLDLPQFKYGNLRGSSNGWFVIVENGLKLKLLNPLTMSQIQLPPISSFPDIKEYNPSRMKYTIIDRIPYNLSEDYVHATYIKKIVLSSSTPSNDSIAIAIYGPYSKLAFAKFGDDKWTDIPTSLQFFHDCIFFNEKIYAVDHFGRLEVSSMNDPARMVNLNLRQPKIEVGLFNLFLVRKGDDLILVERMNHGRNRTFDFNIYKLDSDGWLKTNNLDDYTLFLGRFNTSICVSSECCSELKGNHIYFAFDRKKPFFGIFHMNDRSWRYLLLNDSSNSFLWPHPMLLMLKSL